MKRYIQFFTRIIPFLVVALILTLAIPAFAESGPTREDIKQSFTCPAQFTSDNLLSMAKDIVDGNETALTKKCYQALTLEERAKVFEFIVKIQGGSIKSLELDAPTMQPSPDLQKEQEFGEPWSWTQLIERSWYTFNPLVSTSYYYPNQTYCDNDPSDTDYIFVYYFPSVISDPDSLRLISSDFLVDSMLAYYQWHYGGLKGFGLYNTSKVSICVGDNGIQYGGGADHISAYMKMHRDYQGVPASPMQHQ